MSGGLPRVPLAELPTPLHAVPRLGAAIGIPRLFIKRDDLTGLAFGGNKTRKLELLVADAQLRGADTLITAGAAQSNHARQTAAAAARVGMRCELVLNGVGGASIERTASQRSALQGGTNAANGNLLLDQLIGAAIHWTERGQRAQRMEQVAADVRARGGTPYVIPVGGSNGLGSAAYAKAFDEALAQARVRDAEPDVIVVASSSGGTQAGLVVGARRAGWTGRVLGVSIDEPPTFVNALTRIAAEAAVLLGTEAPGARDFQLCCDYLGGGYGVMGARERDAIQLAARTEGIMLDPVYTGRALGGLADLVQRGDVAREATVLFWHTGGSPALFAYAAEFGSPI